MSPVGPPIVVKRRKAASHGHHGGAWKVAYADFVTAMMAFFLVMWLVGQSKAVRSSVRNSSRFLCADSGTSSKSPDKCRPHRE